MKAALIGLPQSGKSTLFTAISGTVVDPYASPEPIHGTVRVPEPRLEYLVKINNPKKITEAMVEFVDVPGCSLDDTHGQDAWRRLLPAIRAAEVLVGVVRDFENDSVPAYKNRVAPAADFEALWDELIFADLDQVTTRLERIEKSLKKPQKHDQEKREQAVLEQCRDALESGEPISSVIQKEEDRRLVASFAFVTQKPLVCVRNVSDDQASDAQALSVPHAAHSIALSASIEAELAQLDAADRAAFMADFGITTSARERLIRECYRACGLISFFTMGPEEVRSWTIRAGETAVEAAGRIHTDLARGFIRAETVAYDDIIEHTDMKGAKAAGKVRKEGKDYVVKDGDIMLILHSS